MRWTRDVAIGLMSGLLFAGREQGSVGGFIVIAEHDESDLLNLRVFPYERGYGVESNAGCALDGKAVDTGAYGRKGKRRNAVLQRQPEGVLVGAAQQRFLVMRSPPPDGSHGVNDKAGSQVASAGYDGLPGRTFSLLLPDSPALLKNPGPTGAKDRSVDASTAQQAGVCRIHNGIGILDRDIAANQGERCSSDMDMLTHDGINLRNGGRRSNRSGRLPNPPVFPRQEPSSQGVE